jgi:hypothetical protein
VEAGSAAAAHPTQQVGALRVQCSGRVVMGGSFLNPQADA